MHTSCRNVVDVIRRDFHGKCQTTHDWTPPISRWMSPTLLSPIIISHPWCRDAKMSVISYKLIAVERSSLECALKTVRRPQIVMPGWSLTNPSVVCRDFGNSWSLVVVCVTVPIRKLSLYCQRYLLLFHFYLCNKNLETSCLSNYDNPVLELFSFSILLISINIH